jgi:hypothetical protein
MITVRKGSSMAHAHGNAALTAGTAWSMLLGRMVVPAFALALTAGAASGCVASAAEVEDEATLDEGDTPKVDTKLHEESTGRPTTVSLAASTAGIPATPDPNEPQPSPWQPNGASTTAPPSAGGNGPTTSPTATPQPSPWQGHVPPPYGPNAEAIEILSNQSQNGSQ